MKEVVELIKGISNKDMNKLELLVALLTKDDMKEIITLRIFSEEYINYIKRNRSNAYEKSIRTTLKHLINFFGEQQPIQFLKIRDLQNFINHLQQNTKNGYRVYYRNLKAAFNQAIDWNYIQENPFIKIKLPKKQKTYPTFINEDQLQMICEKIDNTIVKNFIQIAFYTGMRLNEIVHLTWDNVDFQNRFIIVGDDTFITKGKCQRKIPICDHVYEILINLYPKVFKISNKKNYVFCKANGHRFTGDYFSKKFKRGCRIANVDAKIHFHSLRHSFASNLAQKGISIFLIKELLGHNSVSTTEIYSHANIDSLKAAIKVFNNSAEGIENQKIRLVSFHENQNDIIKGNK